MCRAASPLYAASTATHLYDKAHSRSGERTWTSDAGTLWNIRKISQMKRKRFEPHDLGHPAPPGLNERVEEGTRVAWDLVLKRWQGENIWITSGSKGRLCQYHFNHHCPPHPHPCPLTHCQEQELAGEAPSALLYHQHCHHDHQDEWQPGGNGAGVGWRSISSTRQHIRQDLSDSILSPDHVNRWGHDNYPRPDLNGCQSRIYSWLQLAEASSFLTPTKMQYAHSLSKHPPGVQKK